MHNLRHGHARAARHTAHIQAGPLRWGSWSVPPVGRRAAVCRSKPRGAGRAAVPPLVMGRECGCAGLPHSGLRGPPPFPPKLVSHPAKGMKGRSLTEPWEPAWGFCSSFPLPAAGLPSRPLPGRGEKGGMSIWRGCTAVSC